MNLESIWTKECPSLKVKNKKLSDTDILIIGGGITGLSCAYFLKDSGYKISLVDKSFIGMGVSSKTTAKLNYLQGTFYQDIEKNHGKIKSKLYFDSQLEAIKLVGDIVKKNGIKCNLEKVNSFLFTNEEENIQKLDKERDLLKGWNVKVSEVSSLPLSQVSIKKGIVVGNTYVFHPLKYLNGILNIIQKNVSCHEQVLVQEIKLNEDETYSIFTNQGNFKSKIVIIACHYPFFLKPGFFPLFSYIKREYVQAAKVDEKHNFTAVNIDNELSSIRFYGDYLIYGSKMQKLTNHLDYKEGYQNSRNNFVKLFKKEPEYTWMNQDLMMNDSLPWIGRLDKKQPNLYIGTGYQAWGMTNGTIAGKVIADLILNKENPYEELFSPLRHGKTKFIPTLTTGVEYLNAYYSTYFDKNPKFYSSRVMFTKLFGVDCGIFIDEDGKKHIVRNLCPHMKCKLIFNETERTWDCPCHGSRFTLDGDVLEGPATYSIRIELDT